MQRMIQTMRWFGPNDPVSLQDIRQSGCTGVVTALHHIPVGDIWPVDEIRKRQSVIEEAGMSWTVIESLPVSEDIKKQQGEYKRHIDNYKQSLLNVAACGLKVVTYNFMPILDWMRTDVSWRMPDGSRALYFERLAFITFDLFMLQRPGAAADYSDEEVRQARLKFDSMTQDQKDQLYRNALLGLPGSDVPFTPEQILTALETYKEISTEKLKAHLFIFYGRLFPLLKR